jgi:protein-tyrosine-phosphatase
MWQARFGAARLIRQPHKFVSHCVSWAWSFHRLALGREHHDAFVLDDMKPGLREVQDLLRPRLRALLGRKDKPQPPEGSLAQRLALMAKSQNRMVEVLFVCQGNINRSSYAELKAKQLFDAGRFHFSSAGMLPRNRRGSPAVAIAAAAQHGVDMSAHRSRHATAALLAAADIVIVFDQINLDSIAARYPELDKEVFLLGDADGAAERQILDPEGKDETTFLSTYRRIDASLSKLAQAMPVSANFTQAPVPC